MLVIKSLIAHKASLPTLIFDEIDEGVSGEVAKKIGTMLRELAASHQVICITHLPQIAARGHAHYFVYKETKAGRTITFVRSLDTTERVLEIAKMLSGDEPTKAALENAHELLTLN
jgi:DNA repair protein RecN (Recombination protein N)